MQLLSENAIVHISAGFEGPFILQAFGIRRDLYKRAAYNFCLTDGTVYIGARHECEAEIDLDNYYLIQITAKFEDRYHPIIVKTLDVVSTSLKKLVGSPPCTLQDYFHRETKSASAETPPQKKVKPNEEVSLPPRMRTPEPRKPAKEEAVRRQEKADTKLEQKTKVINLQSGSDRRELKLASESQQQVEMKSQERAVLVGEESRNSPAGRELTKTCQIKDLYERSSGWVILCRVNYMNIVECQNGLFAANFIISDEAGSEMKCVYFVADSDTAKETLTIGGYYLFTGGEAKYSNKDKELQLTFDRNSDIIPQHDVHFSVAPGRFIRIDRILEEEHGSMVNVIGVIHRIRNKEQYKSKTKFTATLCDPARHIEVDFMLFLSSEDHSIRVGMVVVLHNYQVFRQNSIVRLNSTYKSYYFEEKHSSSHNDLLRQYAQLMLTDWNNDNYRNISMFAFPQRTILDLREICRRTEDDRIYSSLDVWLLDATRKKSYQACKHCKKPAEKKEMGLYECLHCKKIVETNITHTLSVTFADFTSSCPIDVIGQHAETLLGMKAVDFNILTPEEQTVHLETLKYKNISLRLKSERRADKRESHSVWGIEKPSPEVTLKEIRKRIQINRLKQEQQW